MYYIYINDFWYLPSDPPESLKSDSLDFKSDFQKFAKHLIFIGNEAFLTPFKVTLKWAPRSTFQLHDRTGI